MDDPKSPPRTKEKPSPTELIANAKLVAEAAQAALGRDMDGVDKAKVAGAAEDLLQAASHYGIVSEDKGIGKYLDKAENYLHHYNNSSKQGGDDKVASGGSHDGNAHAGVAHSPSRPTAGAADDDDDSEGGFRDQMKNMAMGMLKK